MVFCVYVYVKPHQIENFITLISWWNSFWKAFFHYEPILFIMILVSWVLNLEELKEQASSKQYWKTLNEISGSLSFLFIELLWTNFALIIAYNSQSFWMNLQWLMTN